MSKGIGSLLLLALVASVHAQGTKVIREIVIRGNQVVGAENIRATMRVSEGRPFIAGELERDQQSLLNLGVFQDVKVFSRDLSETEVQIVVDIQENPVVREISVIGNSVIKTEEILRAVTQQPGQLLNFNARRPTAEAIRALYDQRGFFAEVDFPTMPDQPNTMVILVLETKVNDIIINGLTRTRPRVINRLIRTRVGEPLNEATWVGDVRRIRSTQWFEKADAAIRPAQEIGQVDLLLDLKETRTAQFDVGVSLDPASRLAGTFAISDSNFRGTGQRIGLRYAQDTFGSGASASVDFTDPFFDDKQTTLQFSLYSRVNSYFATFGSTGTSISDDRFDERRNGGALSFSRPIRSGYDATLGVSVDSVSAVNLASSSAEFIQQDGTLIKFLAQLSRDRRDVPLEPFEGDFLRVSVEPGFANINKIGGSVASNTEILGNNSFVRFSGEYKAFFSRRPADRRRLGDPRPVLAYRARLGTVTGTVPFYEQFFVGGGDSLRGYPEQRFWGRTAFLTSLEYRIPFPGTDALNFAAFADYGGAWGGYQGVADFTQSTDFKAHLGYGAGVGFRTPLGQIRIDFGFRPDGGSRTHFSIGGSF